MKEPKIRFNEFKGEWEETTFGRISSNYKYGINAAAIPFDGTNKYLRITDIDEESRMFSQQDLTSPNANLSLCNDYLLEDGDITIARTGASVGKSYIYHEKDGKVYFAGFLIRIRLNNYIDKECVYNITLTDNYSKHIRLVSQRSGQPGVNINELKDFRFFLPVDFQEQHSIASFFTTLDAQISASTSRLASLKQIKAASLQAMFPQEGETVPKLRFKGFEGEWEKLSFNTLFTKVNDANHNVSSDNYNPYGKYPIIDQSKDFIVGYTDSVLPIDHEKPIIVFGDHTRELKYVDFPFCTGADGTQLLCLKDNTTNSKYAYYLCTSIKIPNTGYNRHFKYLKESDFYVPVLAEQRAIASFFTNLDRQITLQSQRLEKLKQIKAACLDKMFV